MKEIMIAKRIVLVIIVITVFILLHFFILSPNKKKSKILNKTLLSLDARMKRRKEGYFSYNRIREFLRKNGIDFIYQREVEPLNFVMVKVTAALLLLFISIELMPAVIGVFIGIVGFFIPDMIILYSNKSDNERMLSDIKKVYDIIKVQTTAGVYLTDSLSECYLVVKNERLKSALLEINNEIIARKSIEEAVSNFNNQFHNSYIDTFCIIIKQSLISGKKLQILEDISISIEDVQSAIYDIDKEKTDRKIQMLELMIYIALMAICILGVSADVMWAIKYF